MKEPYPIEGVGQCDACGGEGCLVCHGTGYVGADSPKARRCHLDGCENVIPPDQEAVYCSTGCAILDA